MKKIYPFAVIVAAVLAACTKQSVNPSIVGKWELRHEGGGWGVDRSYPAGNGNGYTFSSNGTYTWVRDTARVNGNYTIQIDSTVNGSQMGILHLSKDDHEPLQLITDTIYVGTSVADGIVGKYVRVK